MGTAAIDQFEDMRLIRIVMAFRGVIVLHFFSDRFLKDIHCFGLKYSSLLLENTRIMTLPVRAFPNLPSSNLVTCAPVMNSVQWLSPILHSQIRGLVETPER